MTKPTKWLCAQRRLRSAWASNQSDQSSLSAWRNIMSLTRLRSAWASNQSDQSSLSARRNIWSLTTYWGHSKDSDQTGRMPKLIWVLTGRMVILLVWSRGGSCTKNSDLHALILKLVMGHSGGKLLLKTCAIQNLDFVYQWLSWNSLKIGLLRKMQMSQP